MKRLVDLASAATRRAWWWLRQVSGDAAYDNYVRRQVATRPTQENPEGHVSARPVLSPEEFYTLGLERKYARAQRCC